MGERLASPPHHRQTCMLLGWPHHHIIERPAYRLARRPPNIHCISMVNTLYQASERLSMSTTAQANTYVTDRWCWLASQTGSYKPALEACNTTLKPCLQVSPPACLVLNVQGPCVVTCQCVTPDVPLKASNCNDGMNSMWLWYAMGQIQRQMNECVKRGCEVQWVGYIKDYDGGTLMECVIMQRLPHTRLPAMLHAQKQALDSRIRRFSKSHVVHPGLSAFQEGCRRVDISSIPGNLPLL